MKTIWIRKKSAQKWKKEKNRIIKISIRTTRQMKNLNVVYSKNWTTKLKWIKWTGIFFISHSSAMLAHTAAVLFRTMVTCLMLISSLNEHMNTPYTNAYTAYRWDVLKRMRICIGGKNKIWRIAIACVRYDRKFTYCTQTELNTKFIFVYMRTPSQKWSAHGEFTTNVVNLILLLTFWFLFICCLYANIWMNGITLDQVDDLHRLTKIDVPVDSYEWQWQ